MIKNIKHKEFKIYFKNEENFELGKKILDKKYKVLSIYKDTERNYVAKIEIENKKYVIKSPKSEIIIPQRRIQSILKKGEGLTSFYNIDNLEKIGINDFIKPLTILIKKNLFLKESFILMEYIEGDVIRTEKDIDEIVEIVKKIHKKGIYHGDLNTSNFIKTKNGIKIIDSQAKREKLWNFKRAYDILTLKEDLLVLMLNYDIDKKYKIKKDIGYLLAYFIKNFKKNRIVKKIRFLKSWLRSKGVKI